MAIAPSKLGWLVARTMGTDDALVHNLRASGLVRSDVSDADLVRTFERDREEHESLPAPDRPYNSPEERVRVFLAPYLTAKGRAWAVPLESLDLPDD